MVDSRDNMETMDTYPVLRGKPGTFEESIDYYDASVNVMNVDNEEEDEDFDPRERSFNVYDCDATALLQAVVFIEDGVRYRSINHKIDSVSLWYYRLYYSWPVQWTLYLTITTILVLAFIEKPSSITTNGTADPRYRGDPINLPCGATETIELACLLIFLADAVIKTHLIGKKQFIKSPWLIAYVFIIITSLADWMVTVNYKCNEVVRFRRLLRPFFLLQNSSLMKKTLKSITRTVPKIASVLLMLMLHIYFFTMFGLLLFPLPERTNGTNSSTGDQNSSDVIPLPDEPSKYREGQQFFTDIQTATISLLVLLTTANNPDVTLPAYIYSRWYSLYFISFLIIGLYFFFNMLTAVIYNEFRGYLLRSMQASLNRRRLAFQAAFEMLCQQGRPIERNVQITTVSVGVIKAAVSQAKMKRHAKAAIIARLDSEMGSTKTAGEFQAIFDALDREVDKRKPPIRTEHNKYLHFLQELIVHRYFNYFGTFVAVLNVLVITVEIAVQYDKSFYKRDSSLALINFLFIMFYVCEQTLKIWAYGWRRYRSSRQCVFDGMLTLVLVIVEIVYCVINRGVLPSSEREVLTEALPLYEIVRVINMLIMFRVLRIISHIQTMAVVAATLIDLLRNLRSFVGILVVIYYSFAILGMELFHDLTSRHAPKINATNTTAYECGSFEQLEYWANNFDDFAAALVVLFDVMVVNNWHIFLGAYKKYSSGWAQLYFISWYFVSVLVCLNVFTALVLENFITKWDRAQEAQQQELQASYMMSVHMMFRGQLKEPTEQELKDELRKHPHIQHLRLQRQIQQPS
ncbi:two pore channel protein 2-like [Amphiura filiformis]|uniref:two pore channel protein 2-like n=1 Tax=Amphiura filiformis TaxID=82378 RepID=UPI003B20ED5D